MYFNKSFGSKTPRVIIHVNSVAASCKIKRRGFTWELNQSLSDSMKENLTLRIILCHMDLKWPLHMSSFTPDPIKGAGWRS